MKEQGPKNRLPFLHAIALLVCFLSCLNCQVEAQRNKRVDPNLYYRAPESMGGRTIVIPIGTTFEGRINTTLSSSRSHPGLAFSIIMSSPVLANGTDVIIPAGSEIIGEVVEAISSSSQPKKKGMPKPRGKLRVQLNSLRTPDGINYPLVASLVGEESGRRNGRAMPIGTGVAYTGTAASFSAVGPGMSKLSRGNNRGGPQIVSKQEMLSHEIFGMGKDRYSGSNDSMIRSLVVRKRDYWIDAGSPLSIRLNAPLKLAVTPANSGAPVGSVEMAPSVDDSLPPPTSTRQSNAPTSNDTVVTRRTQNSSSTQTSPVQPSTPSSEF